MSLAAVAIGRNEGARLIACLASLKGQFDQIIYVDSGSIDGSIDVAKQAGAQVILLDMAQPFTAARARNAGLAAVAKDAEFVQFLDGDCSLRSGWLAKAKAFLDETPKAAVACGRRRESDPGASIYNRLIDMEWNTPQGAAKACGGDALMRLSALREAGGYRDSLIAGEEPELCVRLRAKGWEIWRLDAEMTWHDAAITQFGQWWKRATRAGHAFAEGAVLHGAPPERHWVMETRRALLWGAVLPMVILAGVLFLSPWVVLGLFIYPLQVMRLSRGGDLAWAFFTTLSKFPEAQGAIKFHARLRFGGKTRLIEYK